MVARDVVVARYIEYLRACNERDWLFVGDFVADEVSANGVSRTRQQYVDDLVAFVAEFPDYAWAFERAVVEGEWLAVHLTATGTRRTSGLDACASVTDEFVMYRFQDGCIVHMEGTDDNARLG